MVKGDKEFYEKHKKPCRAEGCTTASCYFAKDNRAKYGHLCWKHPPSQMGDNSDYYESVAY